MTKGHKQLFGPKDENGELLNPSSEHSKEYLEHAINQNDSLDNTIAKLEELEKTANTSPKATQAMKDYKKKTDHLPFKSSLDTVTKSSAPGLNAFNLKGLTFLSTKAIFYSLFIRLLFLCSLQIPINVISMSWTSKPLLSRFLFMKVLVLSISGMPDINMQVKMGSYFTCNIAKQKFIY